MQRILLEDEFVSDSLEMDLTISGRIFSLTPKTVFNNLIADEFDAREEVLMHLRKHAFRILAESVRDVLMVFDSETARSPEKLIVGEPGNAKWTILCEVTETTDAK